MRKLLTIVFFLGLVLNAHSQYVTFEIGQNYTMYDFTNSSGEINPNVDGGSGMSLSLGLDKEINPRTFVNYGLTLDEYNATGGDFASYYNWETSYLGLQSKLSLVLVDTTSVPFSIMLDLGLNVNHIIYGRQKINGQTYPLFNESEFNSLFIEPILGLSLRYLLSNSWGVGISYNMSKDFGVMNKVNQKLHFENQSITFQLVYQLKNKS